MPTSGLIAAFYPAWSGHAGLRGRMAILLQAIAGNLATLAGMFLGEGWRRKWRTGLA